MLLLLTIAKVSAFQVAPSSHQETQLHAQQQQQHRERLPIRKKKWEKKRAAQNINRKRSDNDGQTKKKNSDQSQHGGTRVSKPNPKYDVWAKIAELKDRHGKVEELGQSLFDHTMGLCVALDEWDAVLETLQVMKLQGKQQERSTYRQSLKSCFELSNARAAQDVLKAMDDSGLPPTAVDVALVVAALCKQREWRRALNLIQSHSKSNNEEDVIPVEAYDAVFTCMGRSWQDALRLLHAMETSDRHPDPLVSTYRLVIEACASADQPNPAFQVLSNMKLTPTVYTYELVIATLTSKRQWRRALQLLDKMGDDTTIVAFNTVISACAKAGEVGIAKSLLKRMKTEYGLSPDIVSFNSVITACASNGRWKDALSILDQCHREPGVDADIITYTNAMRACSKGGNPLRALALLQVVKDKGLKLDNYVYAAVIDACAKNRDWKKALGLLEEMGESGLTPNEVTYSVTITACGNGGQWQKSMELLDEMKSNGLNINLITYNAAITALSKAARRNAKYSGGDRTPDHHHQHVKIDGEQLWKKALDLLDEISFKGMEPDGFSYSAAISCCGAGGKWEEALDLIKRMQTGNARTRPNKIAYSAAISACGKSGRHKEALELFQEMKEQGLEPDRVAYNSVLSAMRVAEEPDQAYSLWQEMCGAATKQKQSFRKIGRARPGKSVSPDIITVTNVIGTLDHDRNEERSRQRVDAVFSEAVERGIVLRGNLDSSFEIDLSGLSLPVARAAVRHIFDQIKQSEEATQDVTMITGVGKAWMPRETQQRQNQNAGGEGILPLRDLVQQVLSDDFSPPIKSLIPRYAQGTVEVSKDALDEWLSATR